MVVTIAPQIGELRHKVSLLKRVMTADGQGGQTVTFTPFASVWAAIDDSDGREMLLREGLPVSQSPTTLVIRYRSDLSVTYRITWGTRTFDISSISDVDGHRHFLRLFCMEVQA